MKDLQQQLAKQGQEATRAAERAARHREAQMSSAEDKVKQVQTDAYEAKTKHEKYQRQQRRDHEDLERRLANELRQAERHRAQAPTPDGNLMQ